MSTPRSADAVDAAVTPGLAGTASPRIADPHALSIARGDRSARTAAGRARRATVPRSAHGEWRAAPGRPDPVGRLLASNAGRDPALVPLRMARMASSPFAFLRGAASVMAADLAATPVTGLEVFVDGDAHVANFGLFGTPDAQVVVDLNDFDEATIGPWEWDVKRLTASIEVAGRDIGLDAAQRSHAVRAASGGYRTTLHALAGLPLLSLWQHRTTVAEMFADVPAAWAPEEGVQAFLERAEAKARSQGNTALLAKTAAKGADGAWRFVPAPPILTEPAPPVRAAVTRALADYMDTLSPERRFMLQRYRVADVAHRVVGVGSVGLRAYLAMLFGNDDDDPLFLQIKQAAPSALSGFLPGPGPGLAHDGRRVVFAQRLMQAFGDPLLGWTTLDGTPFYVRQMRNLKGSITPERLGARTFAAVCWSYGGLLARAHARTGDPAAISGYCGSGPELDEALAAWASAYADVNAEDHHALQSAIASGRVPAAPDAGEGASG